MVDTNLDATTTMQPVPASFVISPTTTTPATTNTPTAPATRTDFAPALTGFELSFEEGSLGLSLEQSLNGVVFIASIQMEGQAYNLGLTVNMIILAIDLVSVKDWPLDDIIDMIQSSPRPILLEFRSIADVPVASDALPGDSAAWTLPLKTTVPTTLPTTIETKTDPTPPQWNDNTANTANTANTTNTTNIENVLHTLTFHGFKPLGMKYTIDPTGNVIVVELDPDGQAEQGGMLVHNSVIVSIGGIYVSGKTYEQVFDLLADTPRPLNIQYKNMNKTSSLLHSKTNSSAPTNEQEHKEKDIHTTVFQTGQLGMSLENDRDGCAVVAGIDENGQAFQKGVQMYSTVVSINGKDVNGLHFDEVINLLLQSPRPLHIGLQGPRLRLDPAAENVKRVVSDEGILGHEQQLKKKLMSSGRAKMIAFFNKLDKNKTGLVPRIMFVKTFAKLGVPKYIAVIIFDRIARSNPGHLDAIEFLTWVETSSSETLNLLESGLESDPPGTVRRRNKKLPPPPPSPRLGHKTQQSPTHKQPERTERTTDGNGSVMSKLFKKMPAFFQRRSNRRRLKNGHSVRVQVQQIGKKKKKLKKKRLPKALPRVTNSHKFDNNAEAGTGTGQ